MRSKPIDMTSLHIDLARLKEPTEIVWKQETGDFAKTTNCLINEQLVAWLEPRPPYCDRGHWKVDCNLPDVDDADRFPRYFMRRDVAIKETEEFLRWRLWKQDVEQ